MLLYCIESVLSRVQVLVGPTIVSKPLSNQLGIVPTELGAAIEGLPLFEVTYSLSIRLVILSLDKDSDEAAHFGFD